MVFFLESAFVAEVLGHSWKSGTDVAAGLEPTAGRRRWSSCAGSRLTISVCTCRLCSSLFLVMGAGFSSHGSDFPCIDCCLYEAELNRGSESVLLSIVFVCEGFFFLASR